LQQLGEEFVVGFVFFEGGDEGFMASMGHLPHLKSGSLIRERGLSAGTGTTLALRENFNSFACLTP